MAATGNLKVLLGTFLANLCIAVAKAVAAFVTGSGAMLAESIHSAADCLNQVFLYIGHKEAQAGPDETHPLGRGRAMYFWSFLVALMIFLGGGVFSIREGLHKLAHPEPLEKPWVAYIVLAIAIAVEGAAGWQARNAIMKKKGRVPFFSYLARSKDIDLVVLFAEDGAAVLGLLLALGSLVLTQLTGEPRWDALGSILIGVLLCIVAFWLAREIKSLLQGEWADPVISASFEQIASEDPRVEEVLNLLTMQHGPGQAVLAAKIRLRKGLQTREIVQTINELERSLEARHPEVIWQFIEPDSED